MDKHNVWLDYETDLRAAREYCDRANELYDISKYERKLSPEELDELSAIEYGLGILNANIAHERKELGLDEYK